MVKESITTQISLYDLLKNTELLSYYDLLRDVLKLRNAGDLRDCEEKDLTEIGMSRPEQKRLRNEYGRYFPNNSSIVLKLKRKMFGNTTCKSEKIFQDFVTTDSFQAGQHQHVISSENINLCKELGKGEFGCVYQAAWHLQQGTSNILQVAVKRVLPEKLVTTATNFLQEAAIMTRMRHENVVRLYGVVLDTKAVMLVGYR